MKHAILAIVLVIVLIFLFGNGERQAFAAALTVDSNGPAGIVLATETSKIAAYGYVDAVAKSADGQSMYGKSSNFLMTPSRTSVAEITLKALAPSPAPSAMPADDHGILSKIVVAIIALMIIVGSVYYLLLKK